MKKITIAVCSILFLIKSLSAQEIDVAVGVGTILPGENYCAKLRADLLIENHFSVGVQTNFYADKFTTSGFVLEPNMRIYFNNVHQKNVFYWQLSGFAGQVEHVQLYAHEIEDDVLETTFYPYLDLFTQLFFETIENKEYIFHTRTYDITDRNSLFHPLGSLPAEGPGSVGVRPAQASPARYVVDRFFPYLRDKWFCRSCVIGRTRLAYGVRRNETRSGLAHCGLELRTPPLAFFLGVAERTKSNRLMLDNDHCLPFVLADLMNGQQHGGARSHITNAILGDLAVLASRRTERRTGIADNDASGEVVWEGVVRGRCHRVRIWCSP